MLYYLRRATGGGCEGGVAFRRARSSISAPPIVRGGGRAGIPGFCSPPPSNNSRKKIHPPTEREFTALLGSSRKIKNPKKIALLTREKQQKIDGALLIRVAESRSGNVLGVDIILAYYYYICVCGISTTSRESKLPVCYGS